MKVCVIVSVLAVFLVSSSQASWFDRISTSLLDRVKGAARDFVSNLLVEHATFCRDLECPAYEKLQTKDKYEVRRYNRTNWVSADMTGGNSGTFMKLFRYISGSGNVRGESIEMTVPVIVRVEGESKTTMSFYLTRSDAPEPTSADVQLEQLEGMTVYVRSFGGFTFRWQAWARQVEILRDALAEDGLTESEYEAYYYTAGYDKPWTAWNRHNEIWFVKKNENTRDNAIPL